MRKIVFAALLTSVVAVPAYAQDAGPFTGLRVEGVVGYDTFDLGSSEDLEDLGVDGSIDGVVYGVQGGYDFDLGSIVAGIEGEFTDSSGNIEGDDGTQSASIRAGRDLYLGGRIGFKAGERALIYAKGGYTNTSIELDADDGVDAFELNTEIDGFRVGGGAELLLSRQLYGKVEYRYSNYSTLSDEDGAGDFDIDLDRHQVVAGIGYRF